MGSCACKGECEIKNFSFDGVPVEKFYLLEWSSNPMHFFYYRLTTVIYTIAWMSFALSKFAQLPTLYQYLSYWNEAFVVTYFLFGLGASAHHLRLKKTNNLHKERNLRWFHRAIWVLHSISASLGISVTALYWSYIAPNHTKEENLTPISINHHGVLLVLIILDTFLVAFPVRALHFVYPFAFASSYTVFTVILHFTGVNSTIYPVFDYVNQFPKTLALALGACIGCSAVHVVVFYLYRIKKCIADRVTLKKRSRTQRSDLIEQSETAMEESQPGVTQLYEDQAPINYSHSVLNQPNNATA